MIVTINRSRVLLASLGAFFGCVAACCHVIESVRLPREVSSNIPQRLRDDFLSPPPLSTVSDLERVPP